jgi:hypothetical protein
MFKRGDFSILSKYAIISAVLFCIPILFFIEKGNYDNAWLLYLGNALFLASIFIWVVLGNRKKKIKSFPSFGGLKITILGVIFSCILLFLLLLVLAPQAFNHTIGNSVLHEAPPAISQKNSHSIFFMLFASATVGNVCAGLFATLIAKASSQKDQVAS